MKALGTIAVAALSPLSASQAFSTTLLISEVVDATLPGGLPKYVELTNTGSDTLDLSGFSVAIYNNANTTFSAFNGLSGTLMGGNSFVLSLEGGDSPGNGVFFDTYGFDPDSFNFGTVVNGNDVVALFEGPGTTLLDIYRVIGVDGTGEVWEYTDGFTYRNPDVTMANPVFDPSEWAFSGPNSLETGNDVEELALILANTTPGSHDFNTAVVPLPASVFLLGFAVLGFGALRRPA